MGDAIEDVLDAIARHDAAAGQHFDQDQPRGVDVRLRADDLLVHIFRRHVGRRAAEALLVLGARILDPHGDAEVHDARRAAGIEQDVRGLEVAVDDALRMRLRQRIDDLPHQLSRLQRLDRPVGLEHLVEAATLDILENQIGIATLLAGIENRHDIGMAQLADRTRLGQQRRRGLRIAAGKMHGLDRHLALQLRVPCQIDDALRAASQLAANLESTNGLCHAGILTAPRKSRRWRDGGCMRPHRSRGL